MEFNLTDIIISGAAFLATLGIALYQLFKKKIQASNILFSISSFFWSALFFITIINTLPIDILESIEIARMSAALLLAALTSLYCLMCVYPYSEKKWISYLFLLLGIPGYVVASVTAFTGFIITAATGMLSFTPGEFFIVYTITLISYSAALFLILLTKILFMSDRAFAKELFYLLIGSTCVYSAAIASWVAMPTEWRTYITPIHGVILSILLFEIIYNYAVANINTIDFKEFYKKLLYWLLLLSLLFFPSLFLIEYRVFYFTNEKLPAAGIALIILSYLFFIYKFVQPKIEYLFQRNYSTFTKRLDKTLVSISEFEYDEEKVKAWETFFSVSITRLLENFSIQHGVFYLINQKKTVLTPSFISNQFIKAPDITLEDPLIQCLQEAQYLLSPTRLYIEPPLQKYREAVLSFFKKGGFSIAMPFFNLEKKIIGCLLLSSVKGRKTYSSTFLGILELYRIQFQQQLLNIMVIEKAKEMQEYKHDKMVVGAIKKMITPEKMNQIDGIRVSSFYMNNSVQGGDYIDSILLDKERLAIFISNSSYSGIQSTFISLQLYSALHTPSKYYTAPEKMLNIMNWLLFSSNLPLSPVPSFVLFYTSGGELLYANASAPPLLIYNPENNSFSSNSTNGIPLGVKKDFSYQSNIFQPAQESIGLLYSSSLLSSSNENGENYSLERVKRVIEVDRSETPAILTRRIYQDYTDFIGNKEQLHDAAVIVFKV